MERIKKLRRNFHESRRSLVVNMNLKFGFPLQCNVVLVLPVVDQNYFGAYVFHLGLFCQITLSTDGKGYELST